MKEVIVGNSNITKLCRVWCVVGLSVGFCTADYGQNPAVGDKSEVVQREACQQLKSTLFENTALTISETVAAGSFKVPPSVFRGSEEDYLNLPAFCRVAGSIKPTPGSDIQFELWLPLESWNGKFMQTGNGGAAGAIVYNSLTEPLARAYAVANTDTGHKGGIGDFSWAAGNPQKLTDFAYRAAHELTVIGKKITTTYYGRAPEKSYWNGCSTGGRQGLKEAQFFPRDYDGIIAGAPANNWLALLAESILIKNHLGPRGLGANKLNLLKEAAIKACDSLDGVDDRVISQPKKCKFDPASLRCQGDVADQCLGESEIKAARKIYAGVVSGTGEAIFPGSGFGSESLWAAYASPLFDIGSSYYRNVVLKDRSWDSANFDVDKDLALAEQLDNGAIKAMDPDLSKFVARGGKLLLYHGTTDGIIPYRSSVNYFEKVAEVLGEKTTRENIRLYLVPGMDHCSGGEGAYAIDWITPLERWVESGEAPAVLRGTHPARSSDGSRSERPAPAGEEFTRPICPHPQMMVYKGEGDEQVAESFQCIN